MARLLEDGQRDRYEIADDIYGSMKDMYPTTPGRSMLVDVGHILHERTGVNLPSYVGP